MKRIFILLLISILICSTNLSYANNISINAMSKPDVPQVLLNGEKIVFGVAPTIKDGRVMVPFRDIFELLGYEVNWNNSDKTVIAIKETNTMRLQLGSNTILFNGKAHVMDSAPFLNDSATFVPLRIVSEYSGFDVLWNQECKTALIFARQDSEKMGVFPSDAKVISDGDNIFTSDDQGVIKIPLNEMTIEHLPLSVTNNLHYSEDVLYGMFDIKNRHFYSYNLGSQKLSDISKEDVIEGFFYNEHVYYSCISASPPSMNILLYRVKPDGSEKTQICQLDDLAKINNLMVYRDRIFIDNSIYTIDGKAITSIEKDEKNQTVLGKAVSEDLYYLTSFEYDNSTQRIISPHVIMYNYETGESKDILPDIAVQEIKATSNSLFYTVWNADSSSFSLFRAAKDGSFPVQLCNNIGSEFYIIGNDIYFYRNESLVSGKTTWKLFKVTTCGESERPVIYGKK